MVETVRETIERVMREQGNFNNPLTINTPIGSRTFYERDDSPLVQKSQQVQTMQSTPQYNIRDDKNYAWDMPKSNLQPSWGDKLQSSWNEVKSMANNFATGTEAAVAGYTAGSTLGNFDEGMGVATAIATANPNNYTLGRDATRKWQNDLQQQHPFIYGASEFIGAMQTPMHLAKDTTFANKVLNAATDTLNASAGYAENWNDFGTNLVANGTANAIGLKAEQLPLWRASARPLVQLGKKFIKQGINSSADKLKNMYYYDEEEKYY